MSLWHDFKYRNKFTVVLTHPIWTIRMIVLVAKFTYKEQKEKGETK